MSDPDKTLPEDIKNIIAGSADEKVLLENLIVYIKNRDLKISDHWFKVGQANGRRNENNS